MLRFVDRVLENTSTIGTGTITLAGAIEGYRSFSQAATDGHISSGDTCTYVIVDSVRNVWEVGQGTVTIGVTNTLSRTTIYSSTNSGNLVDFETGTKQVFVDVPGYIIEALMAGSLAIGGPITGGTVGSVLFVGPGPVIAQDNANFFWDDTNDRLELTNTTADALRLKNGVRYGDFSLDANGVVTIGHDYDVSVNSNVSMLKLKYRWAGTALTSGIQIYNVDAGTTVNLLSITGNRLYVPTGIVTYDWISPFDGSTSLVVNSSGWSFVGGVNNVGINTGIFGTNNKFLVNPYNTVDNLATAQISTTAATNKGLVLQGYTSQSADLFEAQDVSGNVMTAISSSGSITKLSGYTQSITGFVTGETYFGTGIISQNYLSAAGTGHIFPAGATYPFIAESLSTTAVTWAVKAMTAQTANLQEWQDSSYNTLLVVDNTSIFRYKYADRIWLAPFDGSNVSWHGYGELGIGGSGYLTNTALKLTCVGSTATPIFVILAQPGMTGNLQEWQNSSATPISWIKPSGELVIDKPAASDDYSLELKVVGNTTIAFQPYGTGTQSAIVFTNSNSAFVNNTTGPLVLAGADVYIRDSTTSNQFVTFKESTQRVGIAHGALTPSGLLHVKPSAAEIGLIVQEASSQTANIVEIQNSSGTPINYVTPLGHLRIVNSGISSDACIQVEGGVSDYYVTGLLIRSNGYNTYSYFVNGYGLQLITVGVNLIYFAGGGGGVVTLLLNTDYTNTTPERALLNTYDAASKGLTIRGVVAQTGNLQEWQNSTPTTVASIGPGGLFTVIALVAPSTPASGYGAIYVDSTSKNLCVKDDAGIVKHGVRTKAAVGGEFLTAIDDDGTVHSAVGGGGVPAVITVADTADASCYIAMFEDATGDLGPKTDAGLTYDATTGALSATGFSGPLTGNVTGDCSGTSSNVTGVVAISNGGTGANLSDPGADQLWGWDNIDNAIGFWTIGTGLSYDHATHTLTASSSSSPVGSALTSGEIWVGNISNVAAAVAVSGVIALSGTGTTIFGATAFGTLSTQACAGNDTRLSDARTPVGTALDSNSAWIGNGSNLAAAVAFAANTFPARGSTGDLVAKTITDFGLSMAAASNQNSAVLLLGNFGTGATNFCVGNDSRLSNARTPVGTALTSNNIWIGSAGNTAAAVDFAANTFPARASTGDLVAKTITDFGLSLVDDTTAGAVLTTLGGTTVGQSFFTLTDPSAITFPRINADNTVTALTAANFLTAIGGQAAGSYQPLDATLTALAGLTIAADSLSIGTGPDAFTQVTFAANTFPAKSSAGNLVAKTISDFALTFLDDADGAAVRSTIGAQVAGSYQPLDGTLTALAGLTIAADSLSIGTGADAFTQVTFAANTFPAKSSAGALVAKTITDFALTFLDDTTAGAVLTTLGGTTVGQAVLTTANPSAIRFLRANADNTVTWLTDSDFRTAIGVGAGTGDVTAASTFGTDNVLIRSDGTGKGVQSTGISVSDTNDVTGVNSLNVTMNDAGTTTFPEVLVLSHNTSGTPAALFGSRLSFKAESTTTVDSYQGSIISSWVTATHASRKARVDFYANDNASGDTGALCINIGANGSGAAMVGFFNAGLAVQQTGDIATALFAYGLINSPTYGIPYLCYEDQKTSGTAGGTFTSGADRTRILNTEVADTAGIGSVASNQVTLPAGTYIFRGQATAYAVDAHQVFLYNATDAAEVKRGDSGYATATYQNEQKVVVAGTVTIAGSKAFELRHRCQTTSTTFGFGNASSFGTEVYARLEFWKVG